MQVYNTLGRVTEPLEPRTPGEVSLYVCGPTVQSAPHLGHGRQAVAFDVICRYLRWTGLKVRYVTNVTDVEDKIIAAAADEGVSTDVIVERNTALFMRAYERLGVAEPDQVTFATDHIDAMLEVIGRLIERGHAYASGGDVYFAVRSFPQYGRLSGRNVDELMSGARVDPGEDKRDPLDFALWKASKPGEPTWDSPWGPGRPGWHIECSAMAEKALGFGFDIHGGGLDLVFPHHENEIAQSEAAHGDEPFARYWLHNGMVRLRGEKMSKSEGNVVDLDEAMDRYAAPAVRLFYLRAHYRQPLDFTDEALADAAASLERLWAFRRRVDAEAGEPDRTAMDRFREAMDDDFNTAAAMAVLFDLVRDGNRLVDEGGDPAALAAAYDEIVGVFGIGEPPRGLADLEADLVALAAREGVDATDGTGAVEGLVGRRSTARDARDFETSDRIRDALDALGVVLEDGPDGTTWHRR
jgi:cysteinyl-tRNA synthetase